MALPLLSRALHVVGKLLVYTGMIYKNMKAHQACSRADVSIEIRISLARLGASKPLR